MSILSKLAGSVMPDYTVYSEITEDFQFITHINVPGIGDSSHATDLEPLYQLFKDRLLAEEFE
jgi:GMP synthase PP-ATPase subunit